MKVSITHWVDCLPGMFFIDNHNQMRSMVLSVNQSIRANGEHDNDFVNVTFFDVYQNGLGCINAYSFHVNDFINHYKLDIEELE